MRKIGLALIILAASFISGCGGGGGTSVVNPPSLVADFSLTTPSMRMIQPGDNISYNYTQSSPGYSDGSAAYNLSGSLQASYSSNSSTFVDPVSGQNIIPPMLEQRAITLNGTLTILSNYISQDSYAAVHMLVENSTAIVNFPVGKTYIASPLSVGLSWTETFFQDDATANTRYQINSSCSVSGTEVVQTGLGNFEAYKVICNEQATEQAALFPQNYSISSESWIYPPLGFVKRTETRIDVSGLGTPLPAIISSVSISGTNVAF